MAGQAAEEDLSCDMVETIGTRRCNCGRCVCGCMPGDREAMSSGAAHLAGWLFGPPAQTEGGAADEPADRALDVAFAFFMTGDVAGVAGSGIIYLRRTVGHAPWGTWAQVLCWNVGAARVGARLVGLASARANA